MLRGLCADALIEFTDADSDSKLNSDEFVKLLDPGKLCLFLSHQILSQDGFSV